MVIHQVRILLMALIEVKGDSSRVTPGTTRACDISGGLSKKIGLGPGTYRSQPLISAVSLRMSLEPSQTCGANARLLGYCLWGYKVLTYQNDFICGLR